METLSSKIKKYGSIAASMALGTVAANGQIIVTEINESFEGNGYIGLDLDDDNTDDFYFSGYNSSWTNCNEVCQTYTTQYFYMFGRRSTNKIYTDQNNKVLILSYDETFEDVSNYELNRYPNAYGLSGTDKYIGVVFEKPSKLTIGGGLSKVTETANKYYGWIRVNINTNSGGYEVTVKEMGYESTANKKIKAGEGLNLDVAAISAEEIGLQVYPNPVINQFTISTNEEVESIVIKNIAGLEIITTSGNENNLSLADAPSGIYFIEIKTNKGIVRKKIFKK